MTNPAPAKATTTAFYVQAVISFGVALIAVGTGILWLPVDEWVRAFLGLGSLYLVTSTFTLAKCVRDQQEGTVMMQRLEEARVDKLLKAARPPRQDVAG